MNIYQKEVNQGGGGNVKENKTVTCKHCGAINKHNSFQCHTIRKPIAKSTETKPNKPITATKKKTKELSLSALKKLATILFNRFIRKRDAEGSQFKCISCGVYQHIDVCDCGHYRPGTILELKFNELNANSECENCNRNDPNHLIGYRVNLIEKIGLEKVLWLESFKYGQAFKMSKQDYLDIIKKYKDHG